MSTPQIPQTDSIQELAEFWDTHDLTDFEHQLEEVHEKVFDREAAITIHLPVEKASAIRQMAESRGTDSADLIRSWVLERVAS